MSTAAEYEVVIVGAGFSGAIMAAKLAEKGHKVLLLEAGDKLYFNETTGDDERDGLMKRFYEARSKVPNAPFPDLPYAQSPIESDLNRYYDQASASKDDYFKSTYTRIVGGTGHHWMGTALRLVPNDFQMKSRYGRGRDWPIRYEELSDWYWEAEKEIGVSGDSNVSLGSPRRGRPYPMPAISPSYLDQQVKKATANMEYDGLPVRVESTPAGRNSVSYQDRPACAGSSNCTPICPIQAKYDPSVHLKRALAHSQLVELRRKCVATRVEVDSQGKVTALVYKHADEPSKERRVTARLYVLAMHAIETAKLLLMSERDGLPGGAANTSTQVGKNLMDHPETLLWALVPEPVYPYRGPISTSGIESLRDGPFRGERAAFRVEIQNPGWSWPTGAPSSTVREKVSQGLIGSRLREELGTTLVRQLTINALLEQLPSENNRVLLSSKRDDFNIPRPQLVYGYDAYTHAGQRAANELIRRIFRNMGVQDKDIHSTPYLDGAGHVMGTFRMGQDPGDSVVDSFGKTHDHHNLYLMGSGMFPTTGTANPTLTIVALALRTVQQLHTRLSQGA